jgi:hypothetical protein
MLQPLGEQTFDVFLRCLRMLSVNRLPPECDTGCPKVERGLKALRQKPMICHARMVNAGSLSATNLRY